MKKYLLSTLAVAGLIGMTAPAHATDNSMAMSFSDPYAVIQAGFGFGQKDYKEAAVFALGAGYHMNQYLKSDITVGLRAWGKAKKDGHSADVWTVPALANLYASMPYQNFEPYVMGGLGMAWNKSDSTHEVKGDEKMSFAWTAGAGIGYRLTSCWGLDLGYRYVDLGEGRSKIKATGDRIKKNIRSHDILLSARYYF
ncbi:MAG: porin family protein [Alphaproteobacteria bacterium]|nr:porin family protein [Alphaproteobacteria bacterium]